MAFGLLALIVASIFAGAAFYINFAEHPARMGLGLVDAVRQWRPAYKRGFTMQATLVVVGGLCAITQWWLGGNRLWLAGGLVLLANWPFTLLVIMPVNRQLEVGDPGSSPNSASLLAKWNRLHAVRTGLGLIATGIFLAAALG